MNDLKKCEKCGKDFPTWIKIDGVKRNLHSRKYCLECSPFGKHNRKQLTKQSQCGNCLYCNSPLNVPKRMFCDSKCHNEYKYNDYITKWENKEISGQRGRDGQLSKYIRRYLFEKYNSKCSKCGWSIVNLFTNKIPLEVDHIDGNWNNSCEENLILLCPNCHSLTSTYRGANRGRGRDITWIRKCASNSTEE